MISERPPSIISTFAMRWCSSLTVDTSLKSGTTTESWTFLAKCDLRSSDMCFAPPSLSNKVMAAQTDAFVQQQLPDAGVAQQVDFLAPRLEKPRIHPQQLVIHVAGM